MTRVGSQRHSKKKKIYIYAYILIRLYVHIHTYIIRMYVSTNKPLNEDVTVCCHQLHSSLQLFLGTVPVAPTKQCSAKKPSFDIRAFCFRLFRAGQKLSGSKLSCNLCGIIPLWIALVLLLLFVWDNTAVDSNSAIIVICVG